MHGEPIRFGANGERGVVRGSNGRLVIADVADVGEDALVVHDAHHPNPVTAFELSRMADPDTLIGTPIGVFRSVQRPSYDRLVREQMALAAEDGPGDLAELLAGNATWQVP